MADTEFVRLTDDDESSLQPTPSEQREQKQSRSVKGSPTCYRNSLICMTIIVLGWSAIIIGVAVKGAQYVELVTMPAISGKLKCFRSNLKNVYEKKLTLKNNLNSIKINKTIIC